MTPQQLPLFDPSYWTDEEREMLAAVDPLLIDVFLDGIESGIQQLPIRMRILVDWDLLNNEALAFARLYSGEKIRGITATTRRQVQTAVAEWIEAGQPMDSLTRALAPVFGERRARLIAQTESTRSYAAGNITAWQSSGLVGAKRWYTVRDERVCPLCGPLHNTIVDIDDGWQFDPAYVKANPELAAALRGNLGVTMPPSHPGCRCYVLPVVIEAFDPAELAERRFDRVQMERMK